jgi:hypothetical protein
LLKFWPSDWLVDTRSVALPVASRRPAVTPSATRAVKPRRARMRERLRSTSVLPVGTPLALVAARSGARVASVEAEAAARSSGERLSSAKRSAWPRTRRSPLISSRSVHSAVALGTPQRSARARATISSRSSLRICSRTTCGTKGTRVTGPAGAGAGGGEPHSPAAGVLPPCFAAARRRASASS